MPGFQKNLLTITLEVSIVGADPCQQNPFGHSVTYDLQPLIHWFVESLSGHMFNLNQIERLLDKTVTNIIRCTVIIH